MREGKMIILAILISLAPGLVGLFTDPDMLGIAIFAILELLVYVAWRNHFLGENPPDRPGSGMDGIFRIQCNSRPYECGQYFTLARIHCLSAGRWYSFYQTQSKKNKIDIV